MGELFCLFLGVIFLGPCWGRHSCFRFYVKFLCFVGRQWRFDICEVDYNRFAQWSIVVGGGLWFLSVGVYEIYIEETREKIAILTVSACGKE